MSTTAEKDDPKLWEQVKSEVTQGDKGGKPGQWSARKAQLASHIYQERGGGYKGEKSDSNSLQEWTDEDWGTKSGKDSEETGERYLPREAREELSDEEYERTSQKKRQDSRKGRQFSPQPDDIEEKTARHRHHEGDDAEPTREDLYRQAQEQDIDGRSKMDKAELQEALESASKEPTMQDLYEEAREEDIEGRSKMSKDELKAALESR